MNLRSEYDFSSFVRTDFPVNLKFSEFDPTNWVDFPVNSKVNLKVFTQVRCLIARCARGVPFLTLRFSWRHVSKG